jgi:hypothetical protein
MVMCECSRTVFRTVLFGNGRSDPPPLPPDLHVLDGKNINIVMIFFNHNYAGVTEADKDDLIHMMAFGEKRPPSPHIRCVHRKKN